MAAQIVQRLPEGDQWIYEVKLDGYRALLIKAGRKIQIRSRNDNDLTRTYPRIQAPGLRLHAETAVIDGEIVAVDAQRHPSFQALQHRAGHPGHTILFDAFDLLHLDGEDLTTLPLEKRRAGLPAIVKNSGVLLSEPLPGTADQVNGRRSRPRPGRRQSRNAGICGMTPAPAQRCVGQVEAGQAAGVRRRRLSAGTTRNRCTSRRLLRGHHASLRRQRQRRIHTAPAPRGARAASREGTLVASTGWTLLASAFRRKISARYYRR